MLPHCSSLVFGAWSSLGSSCTCGQQKEGLLPQPLLPACLLFAPNLLIQAQKSQNPWLVKQVLQLDTPTETQGISPGRESGLGREALTAPFLFPLFLLLYQPWAREAVGWTQPRD